MRRLRRYLINILAVAAGTVGVAAAALALYVVRTWDREWDTPLPEVHASNDPDVIRRGEYLVYGPAHCVECHAGPSVDYHTALERGERVALKGGTPFPAAPLGVVYSKNVTPDIETGIGGVTDQQIARMLRYAVRPNGKASVQLLMQFGDLSDADLTAIISFLRAQPAVRNEVPANQFTVVGKVVKSLSPMFKPRWNAAPAIVTPAAQPTPERGRYLARSVANCVGCHTKRNPLSFAPVAAEFSGGAEMEPSSRSGADPAVWFRTPNITPAAGSALSKFPDRATFIARFRNGGVHYAGSPMPWESYARMSEADLGALYEYLHTLAPQPGPVGEPTFVKGAAAERERRASR
jgi:mono/diheme cytochrome c family protein